jgi:hypothetical protein
MSFFGCNSVGFLPCKSTDGGGVEEIINSYVDAFYLIENGAIIDTDKKNKLLFIVPSSVTQDIIFDLTGYTDTKKIAPKFINNSGTYLLKIKYGTDVNDIYNIEGESNSVNFYLDNNNTWFYSS